MRVRKLSPTGDYMFGSQQNDFYVNQPEGVAQVVSTRLSLWLGEWFLNITDGTDWKNSILGERTSKIRDAVIRARVLGTPGVTQITNYSSTFDSDIRVWTSQMQLNTQFGSLAAFQYNFVTPSLTPQAEPPEPPIDVTIEPTSGTSVDITWSA